VGQIGLHDNIDARLAAVNMDVVMDVCLVMTVHELDHPASRCRLCRAIACVCFIDYQYCTCNMLVSLP